MESRSVTNRVEDLEHWMRSIVQQIERMTKQQENIAKQQEETSAKLLASLVREGGDTSGSGGAARNQSGTYNQSQFFSITGRNLELPTFDGSDPDGWILRAERYFSLNRSTPEEKIDVSFISFEGDALLWFRWENRRHPITNWDILKNLMLRQFRSLTMGSLCEQFLALRKVQWKNIIGSFEACCMITSLSDRFLPPKS